MRIALCQTDILWEEKDENLKRAEKFIEEAARRKADLIVFPEMSFTGFTVNIEKCAEKSEGSYTTAKISEAAARHKIAVGFGFIVSENGKNYNRFIIVDKNGEVLCSYDKIHPFSYSEEGKFFSGGDHLCTVKIGDVWVSPYVCYDLRFPEIFSAASRRSHLLVIIANWPAKRISQWTALLRARAIENQCCVAGINRTGEGDGIIYNGGSGLYNTYGDPVTEADESECIVYGDIIPDEIEAYRERFRLKDDRKEELYKEFFDREEK